MPDRHFPPPWTFEDHNDACFIVKDAQGPRGGRKHDCHSMAGPTNSSVVVAHAIKLPGTTRNNREALLCRTWIRTSRPLVPAIAAIR
jgi:hypothetical protein